jgi:hypothetical protein
LRDLEALFATGALEAFFAAEALGAFFAAAALEAFFAAGALEALSGVALPGLAALAPFATGIVPSGSTGIGDIGLATTGLTGARGLVRGRPPFRASWASASILANASLASLIS